MSHRLPSLVFSLAAGSAAWLALTAQSVSPDTKLCVKPSGASGCYTTIQAAVDAAAPHDTIKVYKGVYAEDVVIGKPLKIVGQNAAKTIVEAKNLSNGFFIDGLDNPGLSDVKITGFTVRDAVLEGIVAANASHVEISGNLVFDNDRGLHEISFKCPGLPDWETDEHFDCGEGIHFSGVGDSKVSGNDVEGNSGGILISDDTGKVHDNIIVGNFVRGNPFDCGIVLASHPPSANSTDPHYGVLRNWVVGNQSIRNGFKSPGEGAGVGMFSDGTGPGFLENNSVTNNVLTKNGLPGVILQSHADFDTMSGNAIVGNQIADNGAVGEPATTGISVYSPLGNSHMRDTVISGNVIRDEQVDVAFNVPEKMTLHNNDLLGRPDGIYNYGKSSVDATFNYWGCAAGPGSPSQCSTAFGPKIAVKPWLDKPI